MSPDAPEAVDDTVTCRSCEAVCCRLEVLLITETGVPDEFIATDEWGAMSMRRENGWCSALDQLTKLCRIYERRPWICREFQMGGPECHRGARGARAGASAIDGQSVAW